MNKFYSLLNVFSFYPPLVNFTGALRAPECGAELALPTADLFGCDKLDVVGVSGLFVSISGFDSSAIGKSKEVRGEKAIILIDGKEIDLITAIPDGNVTY